LLRYNAATGSQAISTKGQLFKNEGLMSKSNIYQPIVTNIMEGKGWHAGSLFNQEQRARNKQAAAEAAAREGDTAGGAEPIAGAQGEVAVPSHADGGGMLGSPSSSSSSCYSESLKDLTVKQYEAGKHIRAEPLAIIAAWLDARHERVEEAVDKCPDLVKMSWNTWKMKIRAVEELMVALGWLDVAPAFATSSTSSSGSRGVYGTDENSSSRISEQAHEEDSSSSSSSSDEDDHSSSSSSSEDDEAGEGLSALAEERTGLSSSSSSSDQASAAPESSDIAGPNRGQGKVLHPIPEACTKLKYALDFAGTSGLEYELPAAAVAATAVALNVAHFSPGLWQVPPKVHPYIGQLLLAEPKGFSHKSFALKCHAFMELLKIFPTIKEELSRLSVDQLAKLLTCPLDRLQLLTFFVGNSKYPYPWKVSLERILTHATGKRSLIRAYPEFDSWAEGKGLNKLRGKTGVKKTAQAEDVLGTAAGEQL
jgi:hypothetical protein